MLFLSSIILSCFVCVLVRCGSDLSASAVLYAHDRYCRGLGRVLVLIIHAVGRGFLLSERNTQGSHQEPICAGSKVGTSTSSLRCHVLLQASRRPSHVNILAKGLHGLALMVMRSAACGCAAPARKLCDLQGYSFMLICNSRSNIDALMEDISHLTVYLRALRVYASHVHQSATRLSCHSR